MSKTISRLKLGIYNSVTALFPSYFKKKDFSKLKVALADSTFVKDLVEKELLVLGYLLEESAVAVDVGANNGLYCFFLKEIKKCKRVLAFEPLPALYKKLKRWFRNVELFDLALSNKKEQAKIRIPFINDKMYETRAKLDDLKEENETAFQEITIHTDTLDNIMKNAGADRLDIIKVDVEGHELKVVEGARKTIEKYKPYLLIEVEGRHHGGRVDEPVAAICGPDYEAWFFDFRLGKMQPFSAYRLSEMQDPKNQNTFDYVNNFFFIPLDKTAQMSRVNGMLAAYFKRS